MEPHYPKRVRNLRGLMAKDRLDKVLLTSPADIFYYSGYEPSGDESCFLVINKDGQDRLFLSPLANDPLKLHDTSVAFLDKRGVLSGYLGKSVIGYDETSMTMAVFQKLMGRRLKPCSRLVKSPREVKDLYEIGQMTSAARLTKNVIRNLDLSGKLSEAGVARQVETAFRENSACNAFDTIIATGENTALIHHRPGKKRIDRNLTLVDAGARLNGYCSDVTRVFVSGAAGKRAVKIYEDVSSMQRELLDRISSGMTMKEIQALHNRMFKSRGYAVSHMFGHGIGLEVHEQITGVLRKNMAITVEPGVYIKNFCGCRIEDTVLVKKGGVKIL